jgi:hypothetical protein
MWSAIVKNDSDAFWGVASSIVSPSMKSVALFSPALNINRDHPAAVPAVIHPQVVIRIVQPSTCTLRQASAPLTDAATGLPLTLAAALQTLFQFALPGDAEQVLPLLQRTASLCDVSAVAGKGRCMLWRARRHVVAAAVFRAQHVCTGHVFVSDSAVASKFFPTAPSLWNALAFETRQGFRQHGIAEMTSAVVAAAEGSALSIRAASVLFIARVMSRLRRGTARGITLPCCAGAQRGKIHDGKLAAK